MHAILKEGSPSDSLSKELVQRVGSYDCENRFFKENFEDLRKSGYLTRPQL